MGAHPVRYLIISFMLPKPAWPRRTMYARFAGSACISQASNYRMFRGMQHLLPIARPAEGSSLLLLAQTSLNIDLLSLSHACTPDALGLHSSLSVSLDHACATSAARRAKAELTILVQPGHEIVRPHSCAVASRLDSSSTACFARRLGGLGAHQMPP